MNCPRWILGIKAEIQQRREVRMRKRFSFLIDEIKESQNKRMYQFGTEIEQCFTKQLNEVKDEITSSITYLTEIAEKDGVSLEDLKQQYETSQATSLMKLDSIMEKANDIETQKLAERKYVKRLVNDSTKKITLSIDEMKMLLKMLAVNDLLDDIDIKGEVGL